MLIHVSDQVLAGLKALGRECPEEGTSSYLVKANHIIINEALIDILDSLQYNSFLGA